VSRPAVSLALLISWTALTPFADEFIVPGNIVLVRGTIPTCAGFEGILEMHRVLEHDQGIAIGAAGSLSVLGKTEDEVQTDLTTAIAEFQGGHRPQSLSVEVLRSEPDKGLWKEYVSALLALKNCMRTHDPPRIIDWEGPIASVPPDSWLQPTARNSVASLPAIRGTSLRSAAAERER
jgi:hypothetical protein